MRVDPVLDRRALPGLGNRAARFAWSIAWLLLFRASPRPFHAWRRGLLRAFGARLGPGVHVYPGARIWAPWNLRMARGSCLGDRVDCYNVALVDIGEDAIVSQYGYLCTASHDPDSPGFELTCGSIRIGARCWIAADVFVGPGVTIGDDAVIGARSSVFGDIPAACVAMGCPARSVRARTPVRA
jgi:putative colanic acid biosynthesis acetyltransferase WcaF